MLLVAAALAYPALRFLLVMLVRQYNQFAKGSSGPKANPSQEVDRQSKEYARKTDIYEKLSPTQKDIHNQAVAFEAAGEIRKAAALFEQISFQRRAIDILENAKLIDDACAILLRMNAIHRAGVVYERHGLLDKAAPMYFQAKMPDKAAEVYMRLGSNDFRYFAAAEQHFGLANDHKQQVFCLITLGQVTRAVELCRELKRLDLLANHFDNHILFNIAASALKNHEWEDIIGSLTATPHCMMRFTTWLEFSPNHCLPMACLLKKVAQDRDLAFFFWELASRRCKIERIAQQTWSAEALVVTRSTANEIASKPQMVEISRFLTALLKLLDSQNGAVAPINSAVQGQGEAASAENSAEEPVTLDLSS